MTDAKKADTSVFGKTYSTKVTQKLTKDGKSWKLSAGRASDTANARSLIKFPLDEIPSGTEIDSARLEMYFDQAHTEGAGGGLRSLGGVLGDVGSDVPLGEPS